MFILYLYLFISFLNLQFRLFKGSLSIYINPFDYELDIIMKCIVGTPELSFYLLIKKRFLSKSSTFYFMSSLSKIALK